MPSKKCKQALFFASSILDSNAFCDPYELCKILGIEVIQDKPLKQDGYLICCDGCKLIFVSSRINNHHRQRFIVAHELGHFLMHRAGLYGCNNVSITNTQKINSAAQENEANEFASELLLPTNTLKNALPVTSVRFAHIKEIAHNFNVSVTHAAMRAIQLSNAEDELLICYEGQRRKWFICADRSIHYSCIPSHCPIDIPNAPESAEVKDVWNTLYKGTVHQEVFHTFGSQYLILLSPN